MYARSRKPKSELSDKVRKFIGSAVAVGVLAFGAYVLAPKSVEQSIVRKVDDTYVAHFAANSSRSASIEFRFEDEQTYQVFRRLMTDVEFSIGAPLNEGDWYSMLTKIDDPKYAGINTISRDEMSAAWKRYQKDGAEKMYRKESR